jgi:drug/metabolite transporter (DMT)-like permease
MRKGRGAGVAAALSSAVFLGLSPVFGKFAINLGFTPLSVVAWRTGLAAGLVLLIFVALFRSYLFIYPIGLVGCLLAGLVNGLGSILFYMALDRLSASIGQMLYSLYPFFAAVWLTFDDHRLSPFTIFRIALAMAGVALLTILPTHKVDLLGAAMMLGAAALYALHLPINQRVLYEVPPPTVTLYTLLAMTAVVVPAALLFDRQAPVSTAVWWPVLALTLMTLLSRLALFFGIKRIGGMQTALLGLAELLVTVVFSIWWLRESLAPVQWLGALVLGTSLLLVRFERPSGPHQANRNGWFGWIRPPDVQSSPSWTPDE